MLLEGIQTVLVKTRFPENIGMAARACANMGCPSICLVDPERWDREKAAPLATAKGQGLLDTVQVRSALAEAVAASSLVLGTTARTGRLATGFAPAAPGCAGCGGGPGPGAKRFRLCSARKTGD